MLSSLCSVLGHMVDAGDLICGTYTHIHSPYMPLEDMAYMCSVVGIIVSGTCITILSIDIVGGCVLVDICPNVGLYARIE